MKKIDEQWRKKHTHKICMKERKRWRGENWRMIIIFKLLVVENSHLRLKCNQLYSWPTHLITFLLSSPLYSPYLISPLLIFYALQIFSLLSSLILNTYLLFYSSPFLFYPTLFSSLFSSTPLLSTHLSSSPISNSTPQPKGANYLVCLSLKCW